MNQSQSIFDSQIKKAISEFNGLNRESLFSEIVNLIKNQISNGIFKFSSIELCDPSIFDGQDFQQYVYSSFPEFYFNLYWHNNYNGLYKAELEFRPRI